MLTAALAALLLAAAPQGAAASAAPATPAPPVAPAPPAVPDAAADAAPTQAGLDELQRTYAESCEAAIDINYGQYSEMCGDLSRQIRRYRTALQRQERRKPAPPR